MHDTFITTSEEQHETFLLPRSSISNTVDKQVHVHNDIDLVHTNGKKQHAHTYGV